MWDIFAFLLQEFEEVQQDDPGVDMEVGQDIQEEEDGSVIMRDIFVGQTEDELENLLQEFEEIQQDDPGADMEFGQDIFESGYGLTQTELVVT